MGESFDPLESCGDWRVILSRESLTPDIDPAAKMCGQRCCQYHRSEASSGAVYTSGRAFKRVAKWCIQSFGGQKGIQATLPAYRPDDRRKCLCCTVVQLKHSRKFRSSNSPTLHISKMQRRGESICGVIPAFFGCFLGVSSSHLYALAYTESDTCVGWGLGWDNRYCTENKIH